MTVQDVIKLAAFALLDEAVAAKIGGEEELTAEEETVVNRLIAAYNLVLNEIATEYYPVFYSEQKEGKTIEFSTLTYSPLKISLVTDASGKEVDFKVNGTSVEMPYFGEYTIRYAYIPPERSDTDDFEYDNTKVGARIFAYGTAAEYCLALGRYEEARNWDSKYRNSLHSALTRGAKKIKGRVWGI